MAAVFPDVYCIAEKFLKYSKRVLIQKVLRNVSVEILIPFLSDFFNYI